MALYTFVLSRRTVTRYGVRYTHTPWALSKSFEDKLTRLLFTFDRSAFTRADGQRFSIRRGVGIGNVVFERERQREDPRCPTSRHKGSRIRYILLSWHLAKRATSVFPDDARARARPIYKGKRSALSSLCVKRLLSHTLLPADKWRMIAIG